MADTAHIVNSGDNQRACNPRLRVGYVVSKDLIHQTDRIPAVEGRASMVHSLIVACGLLEKMTVIPAFSASFEDISTFHSHDYVLALSNSGRDHCDESRSCERRDQDDDDEECQDQFGLGFDCPVVPDLWSLVTAIAGASLAAVEALCNNQVDVAVNWCGGWHHSVRGSAAGFCYVNDIVLAIEKLLANYDRVLYVDLDVHHGDGVQQAFYYSKRVLTVSLHHLAAGFFPGSGDWSETGSGRGLLYSLNIPLLEGARDDTLYRVVDALVANVSSVFSPTALVCQCGADCLSLDPLGAFSVSAVGMARCVDRLLQLDVPTLLLGGGGYLAANAARCWTAVTARLVDASLPADVPEHSFFTRYGPSFEMETPTGARPDLNVGIYLHEVVRRIHHHFDLMAECV